MTSSSEKKKIRFRWLLWPIIIFSITAGILYFFLNPKLALDLAVPEFNKLGPVSAKVNNDVVHINTSLVLTNKSPYALEIDTVSFVLRLGGRIMVKKKLVEVLNLTKRQTDTIPVNLAVDLANFKNILKGLHDKDSTELELSIEADYNTFLGHVSVPYTTSKTIAVPVPPKFKVEKFERHKFRFSDKTMDAEVYVSISNGGNLNLNIDELNYHIRLKDGLIESQGVYHPEVKIKPHSTKMIMIPVKIKIDKPLKVYMMVLRDKDDMPYELSLRANVDENTFLNQSAPFEFYKTGIIELKKDRDERDRR